MKETLPKDRIIFPLDFASLGEAEGYIHLLKDHVGMFKIGLQLFVREGPRAIDAVLSSSKTKVFLDMKFHDIPETVKGALRSVSSHGVEFVTVHCDEGRGLLKAAVEGAGDGIKILGVTVLTSLSGEDLRDIGIAEELREPVKLVLHRARIARAAGCRGIVCSGREVRAVKTEFGKDLIVITPGIRLTGEAVKDDDQKRIVTPYEAVYDGADYIVVGRPIRTASDPVKTTVAIAREIEQALKDRVERCLKSSKNNEKQG